MKNKTRRLNPSGFLLIRNENEGEFTVFQTRGQIASLRYAQRQNDTFFIL